MKNIKHSVKAILFLFILSVSLTSCKFGQPKLIQENQFVLGTLGQIQGYASSQKSGEQAINLVFQRIDEIENAMSTTIVESDIYQVNKNAGIQAVEVSEDTLDVILKGLEYYQLTEKTFNIALGTLSSLWGINIEEQLESPAVIPEDEAIKNALEHIDINQLEIKGREVFIKDPGMSLDLGGIAKGYAADRAAQSLRDQGIESGFVNLGGDIYVLGPKPDGSPWQMGIRSPEPNSKDIIARIALVNKAIITSGDYEKYIIDGDSQKLYHHILDPRTGYPADNELASVSIISDTAMEGDVFATAAFILGLEEGLALIEEYENIEGIFISKDKTIHTSSGIKDEIELLKDDYKLIQ